MDVNTRYDLGIIIRLRYVEKITWTAHDDSDDTQTLNIGSVDLSELTNPNLIDKAAPGVHTRRDD